MRRMPAIIAVRGMLRCISADGSSRTANERVRTKRMGRMNDSFIPLVVLELNAGFEAERVQVDRLGPLHAGSKTTFSEIGFAGGTSRFADYEFRLHHHIRCKFLFPIRDTIKQNLRAALTHFKKWLPHGSEGWS